MRKAIAAGLMAGVALLGAGTAHADVDEDVQYDICTMLDQHQSVDAIGTAQEASGYSEREMAHLIHDAVMHKCNEHYNDVFKD